jgi:hypothetical protein
MNINIILNTYDRKARYFPALLTLAPLIICLFLWISEVQTFGGSLVTLLLGLGLCIPLAQIPRKLGQDKQKKLEQKWGGLPATLILRHVDDILPIHTKQRYHKKLEQLTNIPAPSVQAEAVNIVTTLDVYNSYIDFLRQKTRDTKKFPLIFNENISYGQIRNLLGLKPIGLIVSFSVLIIQALYIYKLYGVGLNISAIPIHRTISFFLNLAFIFYWLLFVTASHVYRAGINYGKVILESCENIDVSTR